MRSNRPQHRTAAVLATHVLGGAHPDDRLMLAGPRTLRDELVTAQAVDAAVAARELGRPKPRLAAARARRTGELALRGHQLAATPAIKTPAVRSRSGRVGRNRESAPEARPANAAPRSPAASPGEPSSAARTTSS